MFGEECYRTRKLAGRCPLLPMADLTHDFVDDFWDAEGQQRVADNKFQHLRLLLECFQRMSTANIAQFYRREGEPASVFGFYKIYVMDPVAWSDELLACGNSIGHLSSNRGRVSSYPKGRIHEIFQYAGIQAHAAAGRGAFRRASDRAHISRAPHAFSLLLGRAGKWVSIRDIVSDANKKNMHCRVWQFQPAKFQVVAWD